MARAPRERLISVEMQLANRPPIKVVILMGEVLSIFEAIEKRYGIAERKRQDSGLHAQLRLTLRRMVFTAGEITHRAEFVAREAAELGLWLAKYHPFKGPSHQAALRAALASDGGAAAVSLNCEADGLWRMKIRPMSRYDVEAGDSVMAEPREGPMSPMASPSRPRPIHA